ncbi:hypothetical protein HDU93_002551 [Gonapodya sp. JEL0774]|nr:hypothetical protein HDU93_002551 [Gonapodya sp. JEL0774]
MGILAPAMLEIIRGDLKHRCSGLHQTFFHDMKSGARPHGLGKKDSDGLERALSLVRGDQDASPAMKWGKSGDKATLDEDGNAGSVESGTIENNSN